MEGIGMLCLALVAVLAAFEIASRVRERRLGHAPAPEAREAVPTARADALFPHPYLGWVHHANEPGGLPNVNDVGLFGRDFPLAKDEKCFTILLTGGSVASQLGQDVPDGPRWLEDELNRRFTPGDDRRFVVLNGGVPGWKQPQPAILFYLHAQAVDAVVTLGGWNELSMIGGRQRLEMPAWRFHLANPLCTQSHRQLVGVWLAGGLAGWGRDHWLPRRLRVVRLLADGLVAAIDRALVARRGPEGAKRTTMESIFALPADYDAERSFHHGVRSYAKWLRAMNAVAARWQVRTAHFLLPVPALDGTLTADEESVVGDLGYADRYASMVKALRDRDVPVVPLTAPVGDGGVPHARLAARMADDLAVRWSLARREEAPEVPAPDETASAAERRVQVICRVGPRTSVLPGYDTELASALARQAAQAGVDVHLRDGGGVPADAVLVHAFHLGAYRVLRTVVADAEARGLPFVLTPFYADWPRFRLAAEESLRRVRAELGLATGDLTAARAAFRADDAARVAEGRAIVERAARVLAGSAEEAGRLQRDFPGARIAVVPVGLAPRVPAAIDEFVAKYGTRDFVLCVGELEPRKNQLALLEALADDPVDVVLATGGYTSRPDYLETCRAFRRRGRTLYLPQLDAAELAAAYEVARLHVLPSWFSLHGRVTLEALRAGCPVVAGADGALPGLLGDSVPFAPPDDPAALRRAIDDAGGASFATARALAETLTLERAAAAVVEVYAEVLSDAASVVSVVRRTAGTASAVSA